MRYFGLIGVALLLMVGCGDGTTSQASATPLPASVYAEAAPDVAVQPIASLRATAKEGDVVVVRAVVGGSKSPVVQDRAVVTVVDDTLEKICTRPGDSCQTPWDYCCTPPEELRSHMATLRFVDEAGKPLNATVGADGKIKPMSTLVVRGTVAPDSNAENLVIHVTEVFVEKI